MSYAATSGKTDTPTTHLHRNPAVPVTGFSRLPWLTSGNLETLALVVIAALLIIGAISSARPAPKQPELSSLKVQAGDTVWTLAVTHPVQGLTTAEVADLITRTNRRETALITPGESILVPVGAVDARLAAR